MREPKNNIYVLPSDTIYVYREPHAFIAFGASGENGRFDFADELRAAPGTELRYAHQWEDSRRLFESALEARPDDAVCRLYRDRCSHFLETPPADDWDGVWIMTSK